MTAHDTRKKPNRACMSYGGGVQSTAIALLTLNRDERLLDVTGGVTPELYLFADTGDERKATYAHVWKMAKLFEARGQRLDIVMKTQDEYTRGRTLSEHIVTSNGGRKKNISTAPFFVETKSGTRLAPIRRGCTSRWKIEPLMRAQRRHFSPARGEKEPQWQQWIGISVDEAQRMKDAQKPYYMVFYPLIWMGWSRQHCVEYLKTQTYADGSPVAIVRSSCVYCPFHDTEEWNHVRSDEDDWQAAIEFERGAQQAWREGRLAGIKAKPFLHPSGVNIDEVNFEEDDSQLTLWDNECAGICGV